LTAAPVKEERRTGANERTVKNWLSGRYGPCGSHLIVLMRHSDEVIESVLSNVGLHDLRLAEKSIVLEQHMQELASIIRALNHDRALTVRHLIVLIALWIIAAVPVRCR
jgi:hypothetical protein